MVHELKKGIEIGKVLFGIRQTLRNYKNLSKVLVSGECRQDIIDRLLEKNIEVWIAKFDKNRNFKKSTPQWIKDAEEQREYFISKFPEDKISEIQIHKPRP